MASTGSPSRAARASDARHPGHRAVVLDELADDADRREAGEPAQVDGGLGVAGPHEHAAGARPQRHEVAGSAQVGCRRAGSASTRAVRARSAAEIPVVTPTAASTVTV